MEARSAITVNAGNAEVYRRWRDSDRFRSLVGGGEVTEEAEGERVAWRGPDGDGEAVFSAAPGGRGTEVHVHLSFDQPGGLLGSLVAKVTGQEPNQRLADDLRWCKAMVETGEVARSDGSPRGPRTANTTSQRPAQPQEVDA